MSQSQLNTMAESNRITSSSAAGATGISENQNLVDDAAALLYQDLFHNKEEEVGLAKSLLSLSNNKKSSKKTTKTPKQPAATPRGML